MCYEVTLGMVCWPRCGHKICLACGYRMIRSAKPHGCVIFDGVNMNIQLSYTHESILCPLCRSDQSLSFSSCESKILTGFVLPSADWHIAMCQRMQDAVQVGLSVNIESIKCVKCPLTFSFTDQCISHITRCRENSVFCPFCHTVLNPTAEEKGVMERVEQHLKEKCPYRILCEFEDCGTKVAISEMITHRRLHAELLLLGEYLTDGQRKFQSLSEIPQNFRGRKWQDLKKSIDQSLKKKLTYLKKQIVRSPDDSSFDLKEMKNGPNVPIVLDAPAAGVHVLGDDFVDAEDDDEDYREGSSSGEDQDVSMIST